MIVGLNQAQNVTLGVHTPDDGSQVAGPTGSGTPSNPTHYAALEGKPGESTGTLFVVGGNVNAGKPGNFLYPDIEYYGALQGFTGGALTLDFDMTISSDICNMECLESTTIAILKCADGVLREFNAATQIAVTLGWLIYAINAQASWTDTGLKTGALAPNVVHHVCIKYFFDTTKNTTSVLSYSIDGAVYKLPAAFQNIPATVSTWALGLYTQWQWGVSKTYGIYWVLIDNAAYSS